MSRDTTLAPSTYQHRDVVVNLLHLTVHVHARLNSRFI